MPNYNDYRNASIVYRGKEYNEDVLESIRQKFLVDYIPASELKAKRLEEFNAGVISDDQKKEIDNWKIKMQASPWLNQQRVKRRKGKLLQSQIDELNRHGMVWNPKSDPWEKKYLSFKKHGLCFEIEGWVKKQRLLNLKGELTSENKLRLDALNFPYSPLDKEEYKYTWDSYNLIRDKLNKKKFKILKEIREKEETKLKSKAKKRVKPVIKTTKFSKYYSKWDIIKNTISYNIRNLTFNEAKEAIDNVRQGKSIYYDPLKEFYNENIKNGVFKKEELEGGYHSLNNINDNIFGLNGYKELYKFTEKEIDEDVVVYASTRMLEFFEIYFFEYPKLRSYKPIDILLKIYKKRKDLNGIEEIEAFIKGYPILNELYKEKVNTINIYIKKLN